MRKIINKLVGYTLLCLASSVFAYPITIQATQCLSSKGVVNEIETVVKKGVTCAPFNAAVSEALCVKKYPGDTVITHAKTRCEGEHSQYYDAKDLCAKGEQAC